MSIKETTHNKLFMMQTTVKVQHYKSESALCDTRLTKGVKDAARVAIALALEPVSNTEKGAITLASRIEVVCPPLALNKARKHKLHKQQCGCTGTAYRLVKDNLCINVAVAMKCDCPARAAQQQCSPASHVKKLTSCWTCFGTLWTIHSLGAGRRLSYHYKQGHAGLGPTVGDIGVLLLPHAARLIPLGDVQEPSLCQQLRPGHNTVSKEGRGLGQYSAEASSARA